MAAGYNSHQVAARAGIHKDTLLRWLRRGLIQEPPRDRRGWRVFNDKAAVEVQKLAAQNGRFESPHLDVSQNQPFDALENIDWDFHDAETTYLTHAIHPYPAKFIPQIPNALIQELSSVGDVVADIFCGSGTTLVEALTLKRHAIGIDANPLACIISRAKTTRVSESDCEQIEVIAQRAERFASELSFTRNDSLFSGDAFRSGMPRPDDEAIRFWFEPTVVEELAEILGWCRQQKNAVVRLLGEVAFSSIVVVVSKQDSDTRYVRREKRIFPGDVFRKFASNLRSISKAAQEFTHLVEHRFNCDVLNACVLEAPDLGSVDLVVCSPPYPNAYSYHLYHMTRMLWLGLDQPTFKKREIGSHRKYGKKGATGATIDTFKAEMGSVFDWLKSHLSFGKYACFIIGNSILKGVSVDNAALLTEQAKLHGFIERRRFSRRLRDSKKAFNPAIGKIKTEQVLVFQRVE